MLFELVARGMCVGGWMTRLASGWARLVDDVEEGVGTVAVGRWSSLAVSCRQQVFGALEVQLGGGSARLE